MYYEEKVIDGILHCRGTPDGAWEPMSKVVLTSKIEAVERELFHLRNLIAEVK